MILHLGHIVAVLRRSPATVEHQDRHHAVVLTKLLPEALLDRSPGCVIELYVCQELGGAGVTVPGLLEICPRGNNKVIIYFLIS